LRGKVDSSGESSRGNDAWDDASEQSGREAVGGVHGVVCLVPSHISEAWGRGKVATSQAVIFRNVSGLATILDRDLKLRRRGGLLFDPAFIQDASHAIHQLRRSLQLALFKRRVDSTEAHSL